MVINPVAVLEQPFNVYVTVYVVVVFGITFIVEPLPPPGLHEYVPPPIEGVAVREVGVPAQTVLEFTETEGFGFTITVTL